MNYQEKTYAAGKIPGGFFKREGRPSEKETLTSRLIDRPIRPLFVEGFKNETQVVVTVLSHDMENDPDILGMVASSAALTLSGVPFLGPIGAARVGFIGGEFVLNPMLDEMANSDLDLVIAGTHDAVMMVESEAKELPEKQMLEAVMFGHQRLPAGHPGDHQARREGRQGAVGYPAPPTRTKYADKVKDRRGRSARCLLHQGEAEALRPRRRGRGARLKAGAEIPDEPPRRCCSLDTFKALERHRARRHHQDRPPHRRPRPEDRAPDRLRGARAAAHARLGAVHAR